MRIYGIAIVLVLLSCSRNKKVEKEIKSLNLLQGEVTLCGVNDGKLGSVSFEITCLEKVRDNFNTATALLHSFEYEEAEKVFTKVLSEDPQCVMAYWGAAMSNYHTLWAMPGKLNLEKGHKIVEVGRSLEKKSARESDYLEAIGAFYDGWEKLDHRMRSMKFQNAMEVLYAKYPDDKEAAIFYALALDATADPTDKTFANQKKAGAILESLYPNNPNHPGVAHYIIHNYDYPELAALALPAARAYAAIAPASAHAQHMPSHIFTRLGLWEESVNSNLNSIAAAQCYASKQKLDGHWEEELHGMDYLVYAYLQQGRDSLALQQLNALRSFEKAAENGKSAYVFAAIPARYALERRQWFEAADLQESPANFPWKKFPWENSITHFTKLLGYGHLHRLKDANNELQVLISNKRALMAANETYKANQVAIQIKAGEGWIAMAEGKQKEAIDLITAAADMEDATSKSPVTPGEVVPARELLGYVLMNFNSPGLARKAYELNLERHPNRLNGLRGAYAAAKRIGDHDAEAMYLEKIAEAGLAREP